MRAPAWLAVLTIISAPAAAQARPELTTNLSLSWGRRATPPSTDREAILGLGLGASLLGDRESSSGFAAGATLAVATMDFGELQIAAGGALLVPVLESFPFVVQAAPLVALDGGAVRPGVLGRLGWGVHSFPRLGVYVLSAGVFVETRYLAAVSDRPRVLDWSVGVDLDAFALLWPWMFLWEAIGG
ncbi:MAG: hypothetical protein HYY06_23860 [Deltaproteobacteria bacterium]|nr:hypothetical protein [Deltaproteobacteria bacterium]